MTRRISAGEVKPGAAFRDAVVEHRRHSAADRHLVDLQAVGLLADQFAKLVGELQNLEDAEAAAIAGAAATFATAGLVNHLAAMKAEALQAADPRQDRHQQARAVDLQRSHNWRTSRCAMTARKHRTQQIAFDAEIEQARHGGRRGFGVQRRQHQMPGQGGMNRDMRGFGVADFADHDDVGILADEGAQRRRESQADRRLDLRLVDAGDFIFDRDPRWSGSCGSAR